MRSGADVAGLRESLFGAREHPFESGEEDLRPDFLSFGAVEEDLRADFLSFGAVEEDFGADFLSFGAVEEDLRAELLSFGAGEGESDSGEDELRFGKMILRPGESKFVIPASLFGAGEEGFGSVIY